MINFTFIFPYNHRTQQLHEKIFQQFRLFLRLHTLWLRVSKRQKQIEASWLHYKFRFWEVIERRGHQPHGGPVQNQKKKVVQVHALEQHKGQEERFWWKDKRFQVSRCVAWPREQWQRVDRRYKSSRILSKLFDRNLETNIFNDILTK